MLYRHDVAFVVLPIVVHLLVKVFRKALRTLVQNMVEFSNTARTAELVSGLESFEVVAAVCDDGLVCVRGKDVVTGFLAAVLGFVFCVVVVSGGDSLSAFGYLPHEHVIFVQDVCRRCKTWRKAYIRKCQSVP